MNVNIIQDIYRTYKLMDKENDLSRILLISISCCHMEFMILHLPINWQV